MTVKETMQLLSGAKKIGISWGGCVTDIDPTNKISERVLTCNLLHDMIVTSYRRG